MYFYHTFFCLVCLLNVTGPTHQSALPYYSTATNQLTKILSISYYVLALKDREHYSSKRSLSNGVTLEHPYGLESCKRVHYRELLSKYVTLPARTVYYMSSSASNVEAATSVKTLQTIDLQRLNASK